MYFDENNYIYPKVEVWTIMSIQTFRTACPRDCRDMCTVLVDVEDGRVVSVKGDPNHEVTRGFACPKAGNELKRLYSPKRLLYPLIKRDGLWEKATWDEALNLVAGKLAYYRDRFSPLSIMHYSDKGSMGWLMDMEDRFFNLFGGVTIPKGTLCAVAGTTAQTLDFGGVNCNDPSDVVNSKTVLIWGRNPAYTNTHLLPLLKEAKQNGAYIILVDPLPTRTADFCDMHISLRPGTDGALALGMARLILDEGLIDKDFIDTKVHGFECFCDLLKDYPLKKVAEITEVPEDIIRSLSVRYAANKPSSLMIGYGVQRYQNSAAAVRAIDALAAITGNIGIKGGGANYSCAFIKTARPDLSCKENKKYSRYFPKAATARHILEASDPPVKMLYINRSNPGTQLPDSNLVKKAFKAVDFKVVVDFEMTETAEMADVVLPCTTFFEQENIYSTWGHYYITYGEQAVQPLGEAKHDWEIFGELAERLGFGEKFGNAEKWLDAYLKPFLQEGQSRKTLLGTSFRCPGAPYIPYSDGKFKTQTGKYELYSLKAEKEGSDPLPTYYESAESTHSEAELSHEYPFYLISTAHYKSVHSQYYENVEPGEFPIIHIGSSPALNIGIQDGSMVMLTSPRGSLTGKAKLHRDFRDDTILVHCGGSPRDKKAVNMLTSDRITTIGYSATFYDCLCKIEPLDK